MLKSELLIGGLMLATAAILTVFRSLALSRYASKLTEHQVWKYDFGSFYGWILFGLALGIFLIVRPAPFMEMVTLMGIWLIGFAAIWQIPDYLSSS